MFESNNCWDILDTYFQKGGSPESSNPLVKHQIDSYNKFIDNTLGQIITGFNPIKIKVANPKEYCMSSKLLLYGLRISQPMCRWIKLLMQKIIAQVETNPIRIMNPGSSIFSSCFDRNVSMLSIYYIFATPSELSLCVINDTSNDPPFACSLVLTN